MTHLENFVSDETLKGTFLHGIASNEPLCVKISQAVRPVRERENARKKEDKHALSRYAYIAHMRRAASSRRILMKLGIDFILTT